MNDLGKRSLMAVVIIAMVLSMIFINDYTLLAGVLFLSSIAIYELIKVFKKMDYKPSLILAEIFNLLVVFLAFKEKTELILISFSIYSLMMFMLSTLKEDLEFKDILPNIFISIYISLTYSFLIRMSSREYILYIFGIAAATDTFAYFAGNLFGKRKLIPRLSPNKTIEGSLGGILGAVIFTLAFNLVFKIEQNILLYIMGIIASILCQIGDLSASYLKRLSKVKDFGSIFRAHGGVMDRFDSLVLITPLVFLITQYL